MKSAERNKQIVIMRAAGHNILDIARSLGASVSTIQRTLRKHPTSKGVASKALIEAAREELLDSVRGDDQVRTIAAASTRTALVLSEKLQLAVIAALDILDTDPSKALLMSRAINGLANANRLSAEAIRSSIAIDTSPAEVIERELPVIVIEGLTDDDVAKMRAEQRAEELIMSGQANPNDDAEVTGS